MRVIAKMERDYLGERGMVRVAAPPRRVSLLGFAASRKPGFRKPKIGAFAHSRLRTVNRVAADHGPQDFGVPHFFLRDGEDVPIEQHQIRLHARR